MRFDPKTFSSVQHVMVLVLALTIFAVGCGSGNSNSGQTASTTPPSGNWQITLSPSNGAQTVKTLSGFLVETGSDLSGSLLFNDFPCISVGNVSGTVAGPSVTLQVAPVGIQLQMTGNMTSGSLGMSGNYTILATGCASHGTSPQTGTWTASLVTPVNGSITNGSITSNHSGNPSYMITAGQISQGPNSGSTNATLTGSQLAIAGYCVTDALNIAGSISGTSMVLNLTDSVTNASVGQISGTISLDGTTFSGKYDILPQTNAPCKDGDGGTVSFSL
jgi:hypothetical protein